MLEHCIGSAGRAASSSQGRHAHVTTFHAADPTNLPWVGQRVLQLVSDGEVHEDNGFAEGEVSAAIRVALKEADMGPAEANVCRPCTHLYNLSEDCQSS
eukprot:49191-Eustigmatos_ZCMA.PRE.1